MKLAQAIKLISHSIKSMALTANYCIKSVLGARLFIVFVCFATLAKQTE